MGNQRKPDTIVVFGNPDQSNYVAYLYCHVNHSSFVDVSPPCFQTGFLWLDVW